MIPVISPNYFMQKASYMQAKLIADTIMFRFGTEHLAFEPCQLIAEFFNFFSLIPNNLPGFVKCCNHR